MKLAGNDDRPVVKVGQCLFSRELFHCANLITSHFTIPTKLLPVHDSQHLFCHKAKDASNSTDFLFDNTNVGGLEDDSWGALVATG